MRTSTSFFLGALGAGALLCASRALDPVDAGTALRLSVPELVERAGLVIEARVADRHVLEGPAGRIETEYVLAVERTFLGEHQAERRVRLPGGVLEDGRGLILPGLPRLSPGEDVLLFLSGPASTGLRMPVGLAQGKFRIVTAANGGRTLVRDEGSFTFADPATGELREAGSYGRRDYAEVVAEIHAAVNVRNAAGEDPRYEG